MINASLKPVNLSNAQLMRVNDIIKLESAIMGNTENGVKLDTGRYRYRRSKTLNELTNRKTPENLWSEILRLSERK